MKKLKLINSIMVTTCAVTPMCALASCSKEDYGALVQEIKASQREEFMNTDGDKGISRQRRDVWFDGVISNHIKDRMKAILGKDPDGYDQWSRIGEVRNSIEDELDSIEQKWQDSGMYPEEDRAGFKPYGNIWYDIPATVGHENDEGLMIQAHMDTQMAWYDKAAVESWKERGITVEYDRETDTMSSPLITQEGQKEEHETSLGADAGAGIALMFALAEHREQFTHGPIRLMFTCDESGSLSNVKIRKHIQNVEPTEEDEFTVDLYAGAELLKYDELSYTKDADGNTFWFEFQERDGQTWFPIIPEEAVEKHPFSSAEQQYKFSNCISLDALVRDNIYISTAGIHECQIKRSGERKIQLDPIDWGGTVDPELIDPTYQDTTRHEYYITIEGLNGGHSAEDINAGYANAFKLLNQTLTPIDHYFQIISIESKSTSAYRIPNDATIHFVSTLKNEEVFAHMIEFWRKKFRNDYPEEKNFSIFGDEVDPTQHTSNYALNHDASVALCYFTEAIPFGPQSYVENDPEMDPKKKQVQTSINVGPVVLTPITPGAEYANIDIHTVVRSSSEFELASYSLKIHGYAETLLTAGENPIITEDDRIVDVFDPVWPAHPDDKLIDVAGRAYKNIGIKPVLNYCHGWLEAACISSFFEDMIQDYHLICLGPMIYDNHTVEEIMWFDTYEAVTNAILYTCNHINELKVNP